MGLANNFYFTLISCILLRDFYLCSFSSTAGLGPDVAQVFLIFFHVKPDILDYLTAFNSQRYYSKPFDLFMHVYTAPHKILIIPLMFFSPLSLLLHEAGVEIWTSSVNIRRWQRRLSLLSFVPEREKKNVF